MPRLAIAAALLLALTGCTTRTMYIESDPVGVDVWVNGTKVGKTPYEQTFVSFGTRFVELEAPGYARLREVVELDQPWWQTPPLDLFVDLLIPIPLRSDHRFAFTMTKLDPGSRTPEDAREAYAEMRAVVEALRAEGDAP